MEQNTHLAFTDSNKLMSIKEMLNIHYKELKMSIKWSKYDQNDYLFYELNIWNEQRFMSLNVFHIEAKTIIKIIIVKFEERSS